MFVTGFSSTNAFFYTLHLRIILSTDMRVGFENESLTVSETSGHVEVTVRVLSNGNDEWPHIGKPFGLRITSKDGSAVGKSTWH